MPASGKPTDPPAPRTESSASQETSEWELLVLGLHQDPSALLGPHPAEGGREGELAFRAFEPGAREASVLLAGQTIPAKRIHPAGVFEARVARPPDTLLAREYRWRVARQGGEVEEFFDPYAFPPLLTDYDLYLLAEGTDYRSFDKLGAHQLTNEGVTGVQFAVWAPHARRVSVVGDFNRWDGRVHVLRPRRSGCWELFLPGLAEGALYKFEIVPEEGGHPLLKADPFGYQAELRPRSASVVADLDGYDWGDGDWMGARARTNLLASPVAIYEVHPGSWRRVLDEGERWLSYRELAAELVPYVRDMGFTHIELTPVQEHPHDASWGYQTVGYYAATSRYGSPRELMEFIDACHRQEIGVLLDWTPAHFARDGHGLGRFDGEPLYEHPDPQQSEHPDWGSYVFDFGRPEVRNFLLANALFWLEKYHADGLRADAVASMLYLDYSRKPGQWQPNQYGGRENLAAVALVRRLNELVHAQFPGAVTVAEESTAWPMVSRPTSVGGLGFTFKWNMGWMNDTLRYFSSDPVFRKYHHNELTFSMLYAFSENFILPLSHDEVVHGKRSLVEKMPGDDWQRFANLRLLLAFLYAHPGKKLLFMGAELGQRREWRHDGSLDWHLLDFPLHRGIQRLVRDLNHLYRRQPPFYEVDYDWSGFQWIDCQDASSSVLSFLRLARRAADFVAVVLNFTPVVREGYRVGVPEPGFYVELLNTDSGSYGGGNVGNEGGIEAEPVPWNGRPYSLRLRLPPLAAVFLKLRD
ncbi:MAG TPA: 1,4-alpha-glucan branching protein GlgB [Candidatus Acidoferrales bacterium]|nr:1,4-alpha-glucan branching protein GlgB [Candidatus Acidoferrales bacterium]